MRKSELLQKYRQLDKECAMLSRYQMEENENQKIFIPDETNMEQIWDRWKSLCTQVAALEEPDRVFSMVKRHFQDFLESLEYAFHDTEDHPERYYLAVHWEIETVSRLNRHPDEERCKELVESIDQHCKVKEQFLKLIKQKCDIDRKTELADEFLEESLTVEKCRLEERKLFPTFSEKQIKQLDESFASLRDALAEIAEELAIDKGSGPKIKEDDLTITVKMKEEEYRVLLDKKFGVSLDDLLSWYQEEMDKTRKHVFDIAAKLDISDPEPKTMQEINDILVKYEGPCSSPEEMLERANEYLKRTRAVAHEYVTLPDDEICRCVKVPESCKESYPWGGYEGGDFSIRPFRGQMFLNTYNYQNVTDGWIKLNSIHEAYPGHHVQYVRAAVDETPETVKIGAKLVPLLEGTCLRSEKAFQFIYGEDPFFPLFVAYRRHHASVRICVDLMLFYFGKTLEEAVEIYERELGFDRNTARGQVLAQQYTPGYFTCYYYGMKKICEWEKEYGFSKQEFTELLFSAGYVSISRFEELIKMTVEERQRYFHEFSSLLSEEKRHEKGAS
nr:DUF885 family protein [uncultured Sellimonas sp.]